MRITFDLERELTPEQHAAIRQQLVLIPVYIWIAYMWWVFFTHLPVGAARVHDHAARDFVHFYTQGAIARARDAHALYDIDAMAAFVTRVVPVPVNVRFPPVYGPQVSLLFAPLAWLSYVNALRLWLVLTIAGYAFCVHRVWRSSAALSRKRWAAAMFAAGAPGLHFALSFGQVSLIGLGCFTLLWLALKADRPWLAGIAIGALAYKPQLGVVAACVFVLRGQWRVVGGAIAAIAAQALAALAYWGPAIFTGYVRALLALPRVIDDMEPDKSLMHSWRGLFLHMGIPPAPALALTIALSIATILVVVFAWKPGADLRPKFVLLVVATLLVDSHLYAYDLLVLAPALIVAWDWAAARTTGSSAIAREGGFTTDRVGSLAMALVMFVYASPILTIALPAVPIQWSVIAFVALGALLSASLLGERSTRDGRVWSVHKVIA
ncbi:MAG: glycosyltransferase family 87 protein [Vicinamibacterales bacterium]